MSQTFPITFENSNGLKLFGVLHKPWGKERKDLSIIILNPGIKGRVAPHRLYVKMAWHLCELGYNVLRFDPHGIGDSEGDIIEKHSQDFYASVQTGRFVQDTISAIDWMGKSCNSNRFILAGLCGGAITALLTGWKDSRVKGILSLGIPVLIETGNANYFKIMSSGQLQHHYEGYVRKVFSPKAWLRFVSFQSNYYVILKSFLSKIFPEYFVSHSKKKLHDSQAEVGLNKFFMTAVKLMVSNKSKILFVFGQKDRLYWEFEEKLFLPNREYFNSFREYIAIHVEKDANHIFSMKNWQRNVLDKSSHWISNNFTQ